MRITRHRHATSNRLLIAFVAVALIGLTAAPAVLAAPDATEAMISIRTIHRHPDVLTLVTTRLTVPPEAQWAVDPDVGLLTVTVETGTLAVILGGGSAHRAPLRSAAGGRHSSPAPWPRDRAVARRPTGRRARVPS